MRSVAATLICLMVTIVATSVGGEKVEVSRATLEKAIDMMEESDDWMNTLKFMMKNATRGFKVESRRVLEYNGINEPSATGENSNEEDLTTVTMEDNAFPLSDVTEPARGPANFRSRSSIRAPTTFSPNIIRIPGSDIIVGDVGVCRTAYRPVMIGSCVSDKPTMDTGSSGGRCVLSAQPHIAWILVPREEAKEFTNCVDIPGVTSLKRCSDWIVIGGKCVYTMQMDI